MSEFLTVRLSSEQYSPIPWLVWSSSQQEVIASGELSDWQQLDDLKNYAEQRPIVVLVAASDVVLTEVDIPPGASRQFESMLPYLLEDEIAQDVDDLHFSVLAKENGKAQVCGVDRRWLQHMLDAFRAQGLDVKRVLPDSLALPLDDEGISAAQLGEQWLFRHSACQGSAVDDSWMPVYLNALAGEQPLSIACFSSLPEQQGQAHWLSRPVEMTMALLSQGVADGKFSLLTGEFKPKSSFFKHWKVWQKVAISGSLLIAALVAQQVLTIQRYESQAQAYREESERIFRQVMPGRNKIPTVSYLKRQMEDEIRRLSGGGAGDSMLQWMAQLPGTIGQVKNFEVLSIKYDGNRGEVRIQAKSNDFQIFEQARVKLSEQFQVEQGQLNRTGDAVIGSFVLKRK
ncbi:TPA: type II secretion system protein GspL [Vibrio vulnificus]|nr:type II secretion system protein GspL [Vibrio vulnificus]